MKILEMLSTGEKSACKFLEELEATQQTLSHYMKILCDSGVAAGRRDGKWTHDSISVEGLECAKEYMMLLGGK